MKLKNKVAIVTGAAGGIGQAIAIRLAKEGAAVVINDINVEALTKVAEGIKAFNGKVIAVRANVTKSNEIKQMVNTTLNKFGEIDILVNVAGGASRGKGRGYFHEVPEKVWNSVIDLNLKGTLICCQAVIKHMMKKHSGKIINIGSTTGMIGSSLKMADYSAAKAGVIVFTKSLAKELGPYGINVNCVSPGVTATQHFLTLEKETLRKLKSYTCLERFGKPEEIANMVLFLASDESNFITGQNYAVCGGRSIGW